MVFPWKAGNLSLSSSKRMAYVPNGQGFFIHSVTITLGTVAYPNTKGSEALRKWHLYCTERMLHVTMLIRATRFVRRISELSQSRAIQVDQRDWKIKKRRRCFFQCLVSKDICCLMNEVRWETVRNPKREEEISNCPIYNNHLRANFNFILPAVKTERFKRSFINRCLFQFV